MILIKRLIQYSFLKTWWVKFYKMCLSLIISSQILEILQKKAQWKTQMNKKVNKMIFLKVKKKKLKIRKTSRKKNK